jgi:hypothetical protein
LLSAHTPPLVDDTPSFDHSQATERATKVACISSTESSTEEPKPSFRISTPNKLGRGGGAVFVGRGHGDVEGQDLVGVPGQGGFLEALDFGEGDAVQLFDGGVDRDGDVPFEGGVEDSGGVGGQVEILLELGTDVSRSVAGPVRFSACI